MTAPLEGVPGYVFGRIRAYREEHPESWRADQTAVYGERLIAAYEQWEIRQPVEPVKRPVGPGSPWIKPLCTGDRNCQVHILVGGARP